MKVQQCTRYWPRRWPFHGLVLEKPFSGFVHICHFTGSYTHVRFVCSKDSFRA